MDFMTSFKICGDALATQRARMDVVASNLANASTTKTPEGGPYRRKVVSVSSQEVAGSFEDALKDSVRSVRIDAIQEDKQGFRKVYDPSHPDADDKGVVMMSNVQPIVEMAELIAVNRSFEATVTAFDAAKNMALKTLEIGK
jgi:flagellar basal-body rod protein FlgC